GTALPGKLPAKSGQAVSGCRDIRRSRPPLTRPFRGRGYSQGAGSGKSLSGADGRSFASRAQPGGPPCFQAQETHPLYFDSAAPTIRSESSFSFVGSSRDFGCTSLLSAHHPQATRGKSIGKIARRKK